MEWGPFGQTLPFFSHFAFHSLRIWSSRFPARVVQYVALEWFPITIFKILVTFFCGMLQALNVSDGGLSNLAVLSKPLSKAALKCVCHSVFNVSLPASKNLSPDSQITFSFARARLFFVESVLT